MSCPLSSNLLFCNVFSFFSIPSLSGGRKRIVRQGDGRVAQSLLVDCRRVRRARLSCPPTNEFLFSCMFSTFMAVLCGMDGYFFMIPVSVGS